MKQDHINHHKSKLIANFAGPFLSTAPKPFRKKVSKRFYFGSASRPGLARGLRFLGISRLQLIHIALHSRLHLGSGGFPQSKRRAGIQKNTRVWQIWKNEDPKAAVLLMGFLVDHWPLRYTKAVAATGQSLRNDSHRFTSSTAKQNNNHHLRNTRPPKGSRPFRAGKLPKGSHPPAVWDDVPSLPRR